MSRQTAVVTSGRRGATWVGMALLLAGALGVLDGSASAASAATAVSCGSTISSAGSYALGADCSGAGITITASDVTLSLNGHTMTGTGAGAGVFVDDTGGRHLSGVTIQGPGKITGYNRGVRLGLGEASTSGGVTGSTVSGLTTANNGAGIELREGGGNTVSGNTANHNASEGIVDNGGGGIR